MAIKSLYKDYFQKSRVFLYPALDIKRGVSVTPIETYVSWKDHYSISDAKLVCLYHLRNDSDFRAFEKSKLLGNKLFHDFKEVGEDKGIYVFDFSGQKKDWDCFIKGKYSMLSTEQKRKIRNYIGANDSNMPYIDSFLNPEKYYKLYAEIVGVKEQLLRDVGELCDVPNLELETVDISIKNLQYQEKNDVN